MGSQLLSFRTFFLTFLEQTAQGMQASGWEENCVMLLCVFGTAAQLAVMTDNDEREMQDIRDLLKHLDIHPRYCLNPCR